jgi:hypothetical protein
MNAGSKKRLNADWRLMLIRRRATQVHSIFGGFCASKQKFAQQAVAIHAFSITVGTKPAAIVQLLQNECKNQPGRSFPEDKRLAEDTVVHWMKKRRAPKRAYYAN